MKLTGISKIDFENGWSSIYLDKIHFDFYTIGGALYLPYMESFCAVSINVYNDLLNVCAIESESR